MIQKTETNPRVWPPLMSYETVAEYADLGGDDNPAAKRARGKRFCLRAGIPILRDGGKLKRVRKADIDAYWGIRDHA